MFVCSAFVGRRLWGAKAQTINIMIMPFIIIWETWDQDQEDDDARPEPEPETDRKRERELIKKGSEKWHIASV